MAQWRLDDGYRDSPEGLSLRPPRDCPGNRPGAIHPRSSNGSAVAGSPFVHLHVHSEYSILDGACRIPGLAARAAELEMPAVGLTDHGSLAGAVELYRRPRRHGVKPMIGCEVYVADDRRAQQKGYAHLTLLAEDNEGYSNLIKLASARLPRGLLLQAARRLGAARAPLAGADRALRLPLRPRLQGARGEPARRRRAELDRLAQVFGRDSVYVELQNAGLDDPAADQPGARELAATAKLPLVATGDVHYLRHEDARAHEALLCIQSGDSLKNPNHWKFDTDQFYFKTPAEMALDFPGHEDAMRRTLEIAERCNVEIELGRILLPKFPRPDGRDAFEYLVELCEKGLQKRYEQVTPELQRAPPVRAEDDQGDGLRGLLPDRLGLHRASPSGTASRSARAAARRPARSSRTASRSPTSTRSATTCSSSASSTRAASRCPTSTSTSPSPGATA